MTRTLRAVVPVLALTALVSCASYDSALVERIEEVWNQPVVDAVHDNGESRPWKAGQWVRMRIDDNGTHGFRTVVVAKEEGAAYWIEFHDVWPEGEKRAALLVEGYRPGDTGSTRILRVKYQGADGEVVDHEVGGEETDEAQDLRVAVDYLLDLLELRRSSGRTEDVVVPAGTFKNTVERSFVVTAGGEKWTGSTWYTNAVPVTGWARVAGRTPYLLLLKWKRTLEVVAFGDTGVATRFFGE